MNHYEIRTLITIIRIVIMVICVRKAKALNRNTTGWGIFAFFLPIIALIWIFFLKPKIDWEKEKK